MANDVRATLQNLISEISGLSKTAGHNKVAEPLSEAGSLEGGTSHPSGKVDDGTQAGTTGTQAAENSAAVKENVGAGSVDSMAEATPGSVKQDDHQLNIGTVQAMTGDDPSSEDDYKETKDEPGNIEGASTSSPATVGDEKFASLDLSQKYTRLTKEAQDLLADLALVKHASPAAPATPAAPETPEAAAVAAGYKEAAAAGTVSDAELEAFMQGVVKEAEAIGDHAVAYYAQFLHSLQKRANELPPEAATESEDHNNPGDAGSNNGGAGGHEDAAQDIAMLEAMGNPAGGGAAAPAPADGGAGGPDAVNELFNALVEMGVTPDDLHAIADQMAGGAGGAGAGGMGGAEAPIPEPKIAAAKQAMQTVKRAAAAGQTWICETKTAKQRQMRQQFKLALADFVAR